MYSLAALKDNLNGNDKKIAINTSDSLIFLKPDDIIYLKADGSYTHIYLINQPKVTVTKRLNEYERLESVGRFMRIHRSHIVNLNHISKILKQDGGAVLMSNEDLLSISADKKQILLNLIEEDRF
jgi:two-component system, LytTR family, response regulator